MGNRGEESGNVERVQAIFLGIDSQI